MSKYLSPPQEAATELLEDDWVNPLGTFESRLWDRLTRFTTLHARTLVMIGGNLEGHPRLLLGGDNGLRGSRSRAFCGERLVLLNLEHRYFAPYELIHLVRVGFVSFLEVGGAWDGNLGWDDLHPDVGVGLRFTITRFLGRGHGPR